MQSYKDKLEELKRAREERVKATASSTTPKSTTISSSPTTTTTTKTTTTNITPASSPSSTLTPSVASASRFSTSGTPKPSWSSTTPKYGSPVSGVSSSPSSTTSTPLSTTSTSSSTSPRRWGTPRISATMQTLVASPSPSSSLSSSPSSSSSLSSSPSPSSSISSSPSSSSSSLSSSPSSSSLSSSPCAQTASQTTKSPTETLPATSSATASEISTAVSSATATEISTATTVSSTQPIVGAIEVAQNSTTVSSPILTSASSPILTSAIPSITASGVATANKTSFRGVNPARAATNLSAASSSSPSNGVTATESSPSPSSPPPTSNGKGSFRMGTSDERELMLLRNEVKMLTMKMEGEQRKRETAEKQLQVVAEELEQLKQKRSVAGAQAMVENSKSEIDRANRKKRMELKQQRLQRQAEMLVNDKAGARQSVVLPPGMGGDAGDRKSRMMAARKSRVIQKTNVADIITRVLEEMAKLEGNIKSAEEGRLKAEGELLEVAMFKQASDELLQNVINDVRVQLVAIDGDLQSFQKIINEKTSNDLSLKGSLEQLLYNLRSAKTTILNRLDDKTISKEIPSAEKISKRASIYAAKLDFSSSPPPVPDFSSPPSAMSLAFSGRPAPKGRIASITAQKAGSRTSTLLDQIRRGKNLTKIDVEAVKNERAEQLKNNRKSMALLSSLQDTLRAALAVRSNEMNLYSEDDYGDWDDGDGGDDDDFE